MVDVVSPGLESLHGSRSRSSPRSWSRHVDSYYVDPYVRNPMAAPMTTPFHYTNSYGFVPASSAPPDAPSYTLPDLPPPSAHSLLAKSGNNPTGTTKAYHAQTTPAPSPLHQN